MLFSGKRVAFQQAEDMEAWMKDNAPWTDRTGRARAGLTAWVNEADGPIGSIIISHDLSLDYPIFLETAYQGRWAIITPTLDYWEPKLQQSLDRMSRLGIITIET